MVIGSVLFYLPAKAQDVKRIVPSTNSYGSFTALPYPFFSPLRKDSSTSYFFRPRVFATPKVYLPLPPFSHEAAVWDYRYHQYQQQKLTNIRSQNAYTGYKVPEEDNKLAETILKKVLTPKKRLLKAPRLD